MSGAEDEDSASRARRDARQAPKLDHRHDAQVDARLESQVDVLLARLVSESGFARAALSRERLVSHLLARVPAGGPAHATEPALKTLVARALVDRDEYARIEALFSPPETWLFRYPESFEFLRARAAKPGVAPIRALLAGCGGWCEPVSVAAALLDGAAATGRPVEVVASDRNGALFEQRPAFGGLAVRGGIPAWAAARFHAREGIVEPDPSVVRTIRVRVADVVEAAESAALAGERYDFVLFRNVAIYLDDTLRRRAFAALAQIVAADGVLLVGHAEMVAASEATGLVASEAPGAFALLRAAESSALGALPSMLPTMLPTMLPSGPASNSMPSSMRSAPRATPPARPPIGAERTPDVHRRGSVQPGSGANEPAPVGTPADPAAFIAIAIACERSGDIVGAERAIGRALYLDRAHEEALVIAARLAGARGAHDEAERFRTRAIRAHLAREDDGRREGG